MKRLNYLGLLAIVFALSITIPACSDDTDSPMASSPSSSKVMIVHASPDAPVVDIFADNNATAAVPGLDFPDNTGYVSLAAGVRNVKISAAGTGISNYVIEADLNLDPNATYSVFAVDSVSNLSLLVLEDNLSAPVSGKAHVRFVHLSPNAPAVDVALAGGGAVVFGDKAFKEYTAFTPLDAGTYDLEVRLAGTGTVVLPLPGITLQDGKIYTVFAKGFVGGGGDQALGAGIIVNK